MESIAPANAAAIILPIHHPASAQKKNHDECHHHLCPGGDSKYKGSGDGIMEKGLQKVTGQCQCASQYCCKDRAGQTQLQQDRLLFFPSHLTG